MKSKEFLSEMDKISDQISSNMFSLKKENGDACNKITIIEVKFPTLEEKVETMEKAFQDLRRSFDSEMSRICKALKGDQYV